MPVSLFNDTKDRGHNTHGLDVMNERRRYIDDTAPCTECGTTKRFCDLLRDTKTDPTAPDWFGCCARNAGQTPCVHKVDQRLVNELLREVMAGEVRTVTEAYPPPVQGPKLPGYAWLLDQGVWWYPHRRPAVLIAEMDKPWRWNTARFLERKAAGLHLAVGSRYMRDAPDDVFASWENEDPMEWLRFQPLMRALSRGLPRPDSAKGRAMAVRAVHWNTCPMRKAYPGKLDYCVCVRDGSGRVVGASNDPATVPRPDLTADELWDAINGRVPDRVWAYLDKNTS